MTKGWDPPGGPRLGQDSGGSTTSSEPVPSRRHGVKPHPEWAFPAFIVSLQFCVENVHFVALEASLHFGWPSGACFQNLERGDRRLPQRSPGSSWINGFHRGLGSLRQSVEPADLKPDQRISPEEQGTGKVQRCTPSSTEIKGLHRGSGISERERGTSKSQGRSTDFIEDPWSSAGSMVHPEQPTDRRITPGVADSLRRAQSQQINGFDRGLADVRLTPRGPRC